MTQSLGRWRTSWGARLVVALSLGFWAVGFLRSGTAWAGVPRTIAYQGKLTETSGAPLAGEHVVTLRLYDAATAGAKLWEEQHTISLTALDNGVFSLVLGAKTPFGSGITFNEPLWLTIEVDGGGEFSPRQPLSSVGYALNADTLDGLDSTQLLAAAGQGDITAVTAGTGLAGGGNAGAVSLSVDVGTTAGKIVQLDADGALPAVSGANLTGITASLPDGSVASAQIVDGTIAAADTAATFLTAGPGVSLAKSDASWTISAVIQAGDIEVGDLPAHASLHQPGGSDALPTAAPVGIGSANSQGTSTSLARADHVHQGVHSLAASGQPQLTGDVTLSAGSNIALTQTGNAIHIAASGTGAKGNRVTGFASDSAAISSSSDTTLLSATITKSQADSALFIIATVQLNHTSGGNKTVDLTLFRDAAQLDASYRGRLGSGGGQIQELPISLHTWDASGAGTYTFTLKARASGNGATATVRRLTVVELP